MTPTEFIFWLFNAGYVANELQMLISYGVHQYYSETQNYFDTVISTVFIGSIVIRLYAIYSGPDCTGFLGDDGKPSTNPEDIPCWSTSDLNTVFVVLWGIATVTLWLRIINFCVLSHSLGPMVTMIFRMMSDIVTYAAYISIILSYTNTMLY